MKKLFELAKFKDSPDVGLPLGPETGVTSLAAAPALRWLRSLAHERQVLVRPAAQLTTRAHAYRHSYQPDSRTLARLVVQMKLLVQPLKDPGQALTDLLKAEPERARELAQLTSIPGMGPTMAIVMVAETKGFMLVENKRQLAFYVRLDVVQRQSGLSVQATRISRRGNVRLRTALYLPAVSSTCHNPQQIAFYARLRARPPAR